MATWCRIRASISANSLAASTGSSAGVTSQCGSSSFSASFSILMASTAFSSSLTGVLYFLASRASCCAYCKGVRPARLITTSFVSSGVGVEVDLSAFAASGLPQASAKVSTSSVIGKFLFENRKVHATRARVKRRRPSARADELNKGGLTVGLLIAVLADAPRETVLLGNAGQPHDPPVPCLTLAEAPVLRVVGVVGQHVAGHRRVIGTVDGNGELRGV